ncbi:MAG: 3-deoxy-7-phosphoheptulonate synthase [Chloroflexi bacterium]|nr:3-deoxy-7-phosphoheptulonate synthase [Chloroflexota bacterium]
MPQLYDINIQEIRPLPSPNEYRKRLPITDPITETVAQGRQAIADILAGRDDRLLVIAGPCSIHDTGAGLEYAGRLKELADRFQDRLLVAMRVYFEKPRTTVGWKGLVYDPYLRGGIDISEGLHMAREFLLKVAEMGLLATTEFLDPITPQYLADLIAWAAIGARTSESQTHRQMASGLSMPVGFKNGTGNSIQLAVDAVVSAQAGHGFLGVDSEGQASVVITKGNPDCHVVLRGGTRGPNYDADSIAEAVALTQRAGVRTQLVVDCSHGNSDKDHTKQSVAFRSAVEQRLEGNANIVGLMLESHLTEGSQKLDESDPSKLQYGISITDSCIGWEETVDLLTETYNAMSGSRATAQPTSR